MSGAGRIETAEGMNAEMAFQISDTSLTRETAFALEQDGLPNSFVPGRNLLFFTFAAAVAWRRGIRQLVGGMCETDFSGYPDCRRDTIDAMASLFMASGCRAGCRPQ